MLAELAARLPFVWGALDRNGPGVVADELGEDRQDAGLVADRADEQLRALERVFDAGVVAD